MDTMKSAVQMVVNEIYQERGEVRPSELIERARPKNSPAHDAFEWDNKKAGDQYRLMQARVWIRRVEIIIEDRPERLVHVPLIKVEGDINLEGVGNENYYKPISIVARDADEFSRALSETLARLNSAKVAYSDLKKAAEISKRESLPDFKSADKGFDMVERALNG